VGYEFRLLFTPLQLKSLTLRNRIVFLQHGNGLAGQEFLPAERQAYYLAERAKGGAALIILWATPIMMNAQT
jgi:2,4-dienoyl-CoA reductase-like NADH-dependent reductase (Old Yellow Enzyme family)